MINFFGQICLIIALITSLIQTLGIVPHHIARLGRPACQTTALFTLSAFITLCIGFLLHYPTLLVVVNNSIASDPWYLRLSGVWNNHVAIMVVWMTFFSCFSSLYVIRSKHRNIDHLSRPVIGVQGFIQSGFLLYLVVFLSPFEGIKSPVAVDLNNIAFMLNLHHLLIYAAYMLISIVYALVIGVLIEGKRVVLLVKEALPWLIPSWVLLVLGSTWGIVQGYLKNKQLVIPYGTVEYESLITLVLMTVLLLLIRYIEQSRIVKKLVLLVGILVFFQGMFGSLINQPVSLLMPQLRVQSLSEAKFLFLFIGLGVSASLMIYFGRVVRSLRKNKVPA
jgi:cytochrome c-type biogenesis protein CcmF